MESRKFRIRIHVTDFKKYTPLQLNFDHYTWFVNRVGSGSGLYSDSIKSVDPDPHSEYGSGSMRAKMTY